ncbi:MAG TPA: LytTR family DNA-binding domain-containing protein [Prolixibacteraceae bacterium]|nr:LytTR family DNA-binding domain-containing protein [Prolixibacteraceae bacterium]
MAIRCLIIDDEPLQQDILKDYISAYTQLDLCGVFSDGAKVPSFLKEHPVDLLFLDINMPVLNGVDLIRRLPNPPMVIFTTAYPEFAVEGFNLAAIDYLLKPISFERFQKSMQRVEERMNDKEKASVLFIKCDKKDYRIHSNEIYYLEAMGDYVRIHLTTQSLITHSTLKNMEKILPPRQFIRIHKSYLIALSKISFLEGSTVKIGNDRLPVGEKYRNDLLSSWKSA